MNRLYKCALFLLLLSQASQAQTSDALYLSLFGRHDVHADYHPVTTFNTPIGNKTKLSGKSFGLGMGYKRMLSDRLSVHAEAGLSRMGIDKIEVATPPPPFENMPTYANVRYMLTPGGGTLGAQCNKYRYNNLLLQAGIGYALFQSETAALTTELSYAHYLTYTQRYFYLGETQNSFRKHDFRYLGNGVNLGLGYLVNFGNTFLHPEARLGIWQGLTGDETFEEVPSMRTAQWLSGFGLALRTGVYIGR